MWSLPNIVAMNARAAANQRNFAREASLKRPSKKYPCECCGEPSKLHLPWYDIFSDDIKGVTHICQRCADRGLAEEGFFTCDACDRRMIGNITWEPYAVQLGERILCLKCAAQEYFADDNNWIDPHRVRQVVLKPYNPRLNGQNVPLFDTATGVLNVARCRHVMGVQQPLPAGINFLDNAEFDSFDGHQISGRRLIDIIQELDQPFCPVLDATYQFSVSVGLYVRESEPMREAI